MLDPVFAVQDFTLGNKLFIVCEFMPYSLLQLLEGAADAPNPSPTATVSGRILLSFSSAIASFTRQPLPLACDLLHLIVMSLIYKALSMITSSLVCELLAPAHLATRDFLHQCWWNTSLCCVVL